MSRELGVQFAREGIRVNALCPGPVRTPMLDELFASDPERAARRLVHIPDRAVRRARGDRGGGRVPRQRRRVVRHRVDLPRRRRHLRGVRHAGMSADLDAFFRPSSIAVVGVSRDRRQLQPSAPRLPPAVRVPRLRRRREPQPRGSRRRPRAFPPCTTSANRSTSSSCSHRPRASSTSSTDAANTGARAAIVYSSGFAEVGAEGRALQDAIRRHRRRRGDAGARSQLSGRHPRAGADDRQLLQRGRRARPAPRRPGRLRRSERRRRWRHVRSAARARVDARGLGEHRQPGRCRRHRSGPPSPARSRGRRHPRLRRADAGRRGRGTRSVAPPRTRASRSWRSIRARPPRAGAPCCRTPARSSASGGPSSSRRRPTAIVMVDDLEPMIDVALARHGGAHRAGRRLAIITTSGGAGGLAADWCARCGLQVSALAPATRDAVDELLPAFASSVNPIDVTGMFVRPGPEPHGRAVRRRVARPRCRSRAPGAHQHRGRGGAAAGAFDRRRPHADGRRR